MRISNINRKTSETDITLSLNIDGSGKSTLDTGCGFLDHMLTLFEKHGRFDISITCKGDTYVDYHHSVEDIGITLGCAFKDAMKDKKGIVRYGDTILPMDESLILTAVDLSGRGHLEYQLEIPSEKVGELDTELVEEFWIAFTRNCDCTLHIKQLSGKNSHHIIEGVFKSVAQTLRKALKIDPDFSDDIMSTKGVL